jgi:hypothetical protein
MAVEIITKEDLQQFREELLQDIKTLVAELKVKQSKEWMKGSEVRKLLGISPNTFQNLKIKEQLGSSKIGGTPFYMWSEIDNMMRKHFRKP